MQDPEIDRFSSEFLRFLEVADKNIDHVPANFAAHIGNVIRSAVFSRVTN